MPSVDLIPSNIQETNNQETLLEYLDSIDFAEIDGLDYNSGIYGVVESTYYDSVDITLYDSELEERSDQSSKRTRSSDETICSNDVTVNWSSSLSSLSLSIPNQLIRLTCGDFPKLFVSAFNSGDIDNIKSVILSYVDDNCDFIVRKPCAPKNEVGPSAIVSFCEHVHNISPDCVFLLRGIKRKQLKNGYILRCKMNMSGTMIESKKYQPEACDESFSMVDLMDPTKVSQADMDAVRVTEILIKEKNKLIHSYMKGFVYLFINELNQKINMYELTMSLSSIKAVEM